MKQPTPEDDAENAGRDQVAPPVTPPSPATDALTRLWEAADASHGHHNEVVAELRERKRQEREAPRSVRRRLRRGRRGVSDPAVPTKEPTDVAIADARVECERCRRGVARASSERVEIPPPVGESAAYLLCSRCADEVRRGLLRLLAGQEPLPALTHEAREVPPSTLARAGWFVLRMGTYALIALAVFVVVSWISVR